MIPRFNLELIYVSPKINKTYIYIVHTDLSSFEIVRADLPLLEGGFLFDMVSAASMLHHLRFSFMAGTQSDDSESSLCCSSLNECDRDRNGLLGPRGWCPYPTGTLPSCIHI